MIYDNVTDTMVLRKQRLTGFNLLPRSPSQYINIWRRHRNRFSNFNAPNQSVSFSLTLPSSFPPSHHVSGYLTSLLLVLFYCLPYVMYSLGVWDFFIIEQYKRSLLLFMFICFSVWQALLFKITKNIECISRCD